MKEKSPTVQEAAARKSNAKPNKKREKNDLLRCIVIADLMAVLTMILLLSAVSGLLTAGILPLGAIRPVGILIACIAAFVAGFVCSRMNKQKGFFLGLLCAGSLFVTLLLVSFAVQSQTPTMAALIKLFAMLLCGAVGGSAGVNMKRKT